MTVKAGVDLIYRKILHVTKLAQVRSHQRA